MTPRTPGNMAVPQERDRSLLRMLAESFLILTRDQIRELAHLGSVRRTNFRLKQLCDAGYLSARPVLGIGLKVGYGYFLGPRAHELFSDASERAEIESLRKHAIELSPRAFPHRHLVDSVHIRFLTAARKYPNYRLLTWVDQYSPWWQSMRDYGLAAQADAYIEYLMFMHFDTLHTLLLEVDTGTERSQVIQRKIDAYTAYARSGEHQRLFAAPDLRVLFIASTDQRVKRLRQMMEQRNAADIFWLAGWETFSRAPLLDPYWVRPHREGFYPLSSPL